MKARESGMPEEETWQGFFDPATVLTKLGMSCATRNVVDVGCGYGTFCLPAARMVQGVVRGFDIESAMIATCAERVAAQGIGNIILHLRDVFETGTGLSDASVDYVMLFNILHAENPLLLLRESYRVLGSGGKLGVMHWVSDHPTPRGPSMDIRPSPQTCTAWIRESGLSIQQDYIDLPPHHFGILAEKG
jgi:ubiquinone/menaquinone biosynthesis C-methylase UbiE